MLPDVEPQSKYPARGVGTNLKTLLARLGVRPHPDCSCELLAELMDDLGPEGCREHRENLLKLMRKNQKKYGWADYLKAGTNMIMLGWIFKLNPLDPLPDLLDKAIAMTEEQQQ